MLTKKQTVQHALDNYKKLMQYVCANCPEIEVREMISSYEFDTLEHAQQIVEKQL